MTAKQDYSFVLGKWFGVTQIGTRLESFARPIEVEKDQYVIDYFLTNAILGFRESHLWISIFTRHPRSPMSRSQRLSIAMVALLTTLLTSIMSYNAAMPHCEEPSEYSIGTQELLISVYSLFVSAVITTVAFLGFRISYSRYEFKDMQVAEKNPRILSEAIDKLRVFKNEERNIKFYLKKTIRSLRKEYYYPVHARAEVKNYVVVHKIRLIFAWILCFTVIFFMCFFIVLYGLKIGKVKSKLWLTSIAMSISEDVIVVDTTKIILISLLFGIVQTQLVNLHVCDPKIYEMRKGPVKTHLRNDRLALEMRLQECYKPPSIERRDIIEKRKEKIQYWWQFIDILDICFAFTLLFIFTSQASHGYYNNSHFAKMMFNVYVDETPVQTSIRNDSSYYRYLKSNVFPMIYASRWYNYQLMTAEREAFAESGWTRDTMHRMLGVPRLRQQRVLRTSCRKPPILQNLSFYCNIPFSSTTEDTDDYGDQWSGFVSGDIYFTSSPWLYHFPQINHSSLSIVTESGQRFDGGGYIAELKRTRSHTVDTIFSLEDTGWLDFRTRVVFLEMSMYNVNQHTYSFIVFVTEHMQSTMVLSDKKCWSIFPIKNTALEIVYLLYTFLSIIKLAMILNVVGMTVFLNSFWAIYDLVIIILCNLCFMSYRILLEIYELQVHKFNTKGADTFFQFQTIMYYVNLQRDLCGLLFIFTTARSLRLLKYGTRITFEKQKHTLYFSWPKIVWMTAILVTILFSLQRVITYSVNTLYPLGISQLFLQKTNFFHVHSTILSVESKLFIIISCYISSVAMLFFIIVLVKSYTVASSRLS